MNIPTPEQIFEGEVIESLKTEHKETKASRKVADMLCQLACDKGIELILDQNSEPHVIFPEKLSVAFPVRSATFHRWLSGINYAETQKGFSGSTFEQVASTLEGKAFHEDKKETLYNRVARVDDRIYYDLGDDKRVVEIDCDGWKILDEFPVIFRRFSHQLPQVEPQDGGNIEDILKFINLKNDEDKILILTYLVTVLVPDIPRVILVCVGEQGAAKSTLLRISRSLIDPSRAELLRLRNSADELSQMASHNYCFYLDNISYLNTEVSDSLSAYTTGIGNSKRKLYSDDDDVIYDIKTAIGLSGINLMANKPDLLDRCLILELERIPEESRIEEKVFWENFNNQKPKLLGALFTVLSKTLTQAKTIVLHSRPRMADYAKYAAAASEVLGFGSEKFIEAFGTNVKRQNQAAIDASPTAQVILEFMSTRDSWEGSPSNLYTELAEVADTLKVQIGGSMGFPKSSSWLTRKINEVLTNLTALGIKVDTGGRTEISRYLKLSKTVKNAVSDDIAVILPQESMTAHDGISNAVIINQPQNDSTKVLTAKKPSQDNEIDYTDDEGVPF